MSIPTVRSWRLKLSRAQVHLDELGELLLPFGQTHEYRVAESVEQKGVRSYRAWSTAQPDPYIAVVLGDLLFNVRSALDHLAVALVPAKRAYKASFPILTIDPEAIHPRDLKGDAGRREIWEKATTGMSDAAVAIIRSVQPFSLSPPPILANISLGPEDAVLAVLSQFQNADKHRRLIITVGSLAPVAIDIRDTRTGQPLDVEYPPLKPTEIIKNGAVIFRSPTEVDVQAEGTTNVSAGVTKNERGPYRQLPGFPIELLRAVRPRLPTGSKP